MRGASFGKQEYSCVKAEPNFATASRVYGSLPQPGLRGEKNQLKRMAKQARTTTIVLTSKHPTPLATWAGISDHSDEEASYPLRPQSCVFSTETYGPSPSC